MSLTQLINRTVVIETHSDTEEIDEAGDAVESVASIETVCEIQPRDSSEPSAHPDIADSDWFGWFLPADIDHLNSASVVWVPGEGDFEVVGEARLRRNPRTGVDTVVEAGLNRIAGSEDSRGS